MYNGTTVVMGGLITEDRKGDGEDKIPFLGDLPYVSRLFRRSRAVDSARARWPCWSL